MTVVTSGSIVRTSASWAASGGSTSTTPVTGPPGAVRAPRMRAASASPMATKTIGTSVSVSMSVCADGAEIVTMTSGRAAANAAAIAAAFAASASALSNRKFRFAPAA